MAAPWYITRIVLILLAQSISFLTRQEEDLLKFQQWIDRARQAPRSSYDKIISYRRAIESDPFNPQPRFELGEVYYEIAIVYGHRDLFDEAAGLFRDALELDPSLFQAHYRLGTIYFLRKNFEHCRRELEAARKINPGFESAIDSLAILSRDIPTGEP